MSSLSLNKYTSFIEGLEIESGDKFFPIWLLVNPKYPNDITNLWNPIMYEIQEKVFRKLHERINSKNIYKKDIYSNIGRIRRTSIEAKITEDVELFRESVNKHQPKLLFTFDAITSEFARRAFNQRSQNGPKYWHTRNLKDEFEQSIAHFDITRTNLIPLIRQNTKSWKNIYEWEEDSNSYCFDVATRLAEKIIENRDNLDIWI